MVMVGEDSGSLQADSRPKVVGFVRGSRPLNRMNSRNYDDSNIKLFIFFNMGDYYYYYYYITICDVMLFPSAQSETSYAMLGVM